jgi:two-component system, response regulator
MFDNLLDIILVESNPIDVDFALQSLQEHNLANRVKVLRDGEEALNYIFRKGQYSDSGISGHPVLILLNITLPKVDGLDILRRIRENERTKRIPVVLITGSASEAQRLEGYNLGVNSYITKPIEFDKFAKTISQIGLYWAVLNEPPR